MNLLRIGSYELIPEINGLRLRMSEPSLTTKLSNAQTQFLSGLPSLKADGIFSAEESDFVASLENLVELEHREFDPLSNLLDWAPFILKLEGKGMLGFDDFKIIPRFYLGKRVVQIKTIGIICWRNHQVYRIPATQALALNLISEFNSLDPALKNKTRSLELLYQLKTLASPNANIQFDEYLASENVVKPTSIGLRTHDDGKRAAVYPVMEGVSEEALKKQFLNVSEVQEVIDIGTFEDSGRQRVLISDELREVLKTIKRTGFGISGERRDQFYRNPRSILPEGDDHNYDLIDLTGFGPRVKGIGFPAFARAINSSTKEKWFGELNAEETDETLSSGKAIAIECSFVDGESKIIEFETLKEADSFLATVNSELAKGNSSVEWNDISIPISGVFAATLASEIDNSAKGFKEKRERSQSKRLLIHTNEDVLDYTESIGDIKSNFQFALPTSLKLSVVLKDHQTSGVSWLGGLLNRDISKGALLADDMGLGKTLQLLTFLAWCIESELKEQLGSDSPPYEPILVVAPLILLETWDKEIKKYFDPSIFSPYEKLHGAVLKQYRLAGSDGRETEPGQETLDIVKLRKNRLIITNYETVKNYQYTFAKIPWSVLIIDEAQEIKEPSTAVTYALKVLNPTFRIASTGTPVETSLTNLWSIMDFAQPGNALGSLKDFKKDYGEFTYDDPELGQKLRDALGFNSDKGLILRRSKKDVLKDLPPKSIVEHFCIMEEDILLKYQEIIQHVQSSSRGNIAALQGLHRLAQLSQHPFLFEGDPFRLDHKEYLTCSSKLRTLIQILENVKAKSEKALVFTRSRKMQDILKAVLDAEFGLDVGIVNGETASRHKYVSNTREGIIERFSEKPQFDILILSPEVAGVGLTITAANHVIHYGRWWNPAKENQATDRAYRIGQDKPVFVHHLLLRDASGTIETFDEKLHRLLKTREDLADNFLVPSGDERAIEGDLMGNIFTAKSSSKKDSNSKVKPFLDRLTPFEFECAVGQIYKTRCKDVFVTPRTGDRGIDVMGVGEREILLIQCKMLSAGSICQTDAFDELIDGADYYREYVIPKRLKHLPIKLVLATTGLSDKALLSEANSKEIELLCGSSMQKSFSSTDLSFSDLYSMDNSRPRNVDELAIELEKYFSKG